MADVLKVVREPTLGAHLARLSDHELLDFMYNTQASIDDLRNMIDVCVKELARRHPSPPQPDNAA